MTPERAAFLRLMGPWRCGVSIASLNATYHYEGGRVVYQYLGGRKFDAMPSSGRYRGHADGSCEQCRWVATGEKCLQ